MTDEAPPKKCSCCNEQPRVEARPGIFLCRRCDINNWWMHR